ncbi:MAG: hypothetical protein ACYCSZ_15065 [Burkholderiales bacterium]
MSKILDVVNKKHYIFNLIVKTPSHSILSRLSDHFIIILTGLVSAIIGGAITGYFSIIQVNKAHKNDIEIKKLEEEKLISGVKQGIYQEVKILWDLSYGNSDNGQNESPGNILEKIDNPSDDFEKQFKNVQQLLNTGSMSAETFTKIIELTNKLSITSFSRYYPITQNYFIILDRNAHLIGRIEDNEIRNAIIKGYGMMKGLVDSFKFNNDLVNKFENMGHIFNKTRAVQDANVFIFRIDMLYKYLYKLKIAHERIKREVIEGENSLLKLLEKDFEKNKTAKIE